MELVEGEDLSQHILRGPMPLAAALPIAKQIADALEAAHERGMSTTVQRSGAGPSITLGRPMPLNIPDNIDLVALAPDGTRFLARRAHPSAPPTLAIVENLFEELRAKLPVK